jgi:Holliday junction resolvase
MFTTRLFVLSFNMNTHAKGYRREYQCKLELVALGYLVERKNFARHCAIDFFGLFDLVAIRGGECLWVQVKSARSPALASVKAILKWKKETGVCLPCQVWYKLNRKPWVVLDA